MSEPERSMEERILQAVKLTLASVIKDTATPHGMRHPLSDGTIEDLRQCLSLIAARERELKAQAGQGQEERPRFADETRAGVSPVHFHKRKPSGE